MPGPSRGDQLARSEPSERSREKNRRTLHDNRPGGSAKSPCWFRPIHSATAYREHCSRLFRCPVFQGRGSTALPNPKSIVWLDSVEMERAIRERGAPLLATPGSILAPCDLRGVYQLATSICRPAGSSCRREEDSRSREGGR